MASKKKIQPARKIDKKSKKQPTPTQILEKKSLEIKKFFKDKKGGNYHKSTKALLELYPIVFNRVSSAKKVGFSSFADVAIISGLRFKLISSLNMSVLSNDYKVLFNRIYDIMSEMKVHGYV